MRQNLNTMFAKRTIAGNAFVEKSLLAGCERAFVAGVHQLPLANHVNGASPPRGTKQEMKKTLLFIAVAALMLNATGCGNCGSLFGFRRNACATPMIGSVQRCAPVCCQPTCCVPACDPCCTDGTAVSYGYDGSAPMIMGAPMVTSDCNCGP